MDIPSRLAELQPTLAAEVEMLHAKLQARSRGANTDNRDSRLGRHRANQTPSQEVLGQVAEPAAYRTRQCRFGNNRCRAPDPLLSTMRNVLCFCPLARTGWTAVGSRRLRNHGLATRPRPTQLQLIVAACTRPNTIQLFPFLRPHPKHLHLLSRTAILHLGDNSNDRSGGTFRMAHDTSTHVANLVRRVSQMHHDTQPGRTFAPTGRNGLFASRHDECLFFPRVSKPPQSFGAPIF